MSGDLLFGHLDDYYNITYHNYHTICIIKLTFYAVGQFLHWGKKLEHTQK